MQRRSWFSVGWTASRGPRLAAVMCCLARKSSIADKNPRPVLILCWQRTLQPVGQTIKKNILQKINHAHKSNTWYMIPIDSVVVFWAPISLRYTVTVANDVQPLCPFRQPVQTMYFDATSCKQSKERNDKIYEIIYSCLLQHQFTRKETRKVLQINSNSWASQHISLEP